MTAIARLLLLAVLLAPTLWLVAAALGPPDASDRAGPWDPAARHAAATTLAIALVATAAGAALGLPYGWRMARAGTDARRLLLSASLLPVLLPPYAHALAWLLLLGREGPLRTVLPAGMSAASITGSPWTAGLVLAAALWPVNAWFICVAARATPRDLEDAARMELAPGPAAWLAAWPAVRGGLAAGALLVFLLAAADFGVPGSLGVGSLSREIADRFQAGYDFREAGLLALPLLVAALPLVGANLRWIERIELASRDAQEAARGGGSGLAGWLLALLALAIGAIAPLSALLYYARDAFPVGAVWNEAAPALITSGALGMMAAILAVGVALALRGLVAAGQLLLMLPYALPGSLVAIAAIGIMNRPGPLGDLYGTIWQLLWVYTVLFVPFAYRAVAAGWRRIDPDLLGEAGLSGAGTWARFRAVTWPAVSSHAGLAAAIVWLLAAREMDATALLRTPGLATAAFKIHDYLHFYPVPQVALLCLLMVVGQLLVVAAGALLWWLVRRKGQKSLGGRFEGSVRPLTRAPSPTTRLPRG